MNRKGPDNRNLIRFPALPALVALALYLSPHSGLADEGESRRSCGTAWTGWVTAAEPDLNPCPAGCERGERLKDRTWGQGAELQYDVQYQCWFPEGSSGQSISGPTGTPATSATSTGTTTAPADSGSTATVTPSGTGLMGPAVLTRDPLFAVGAGRNHGVGIRADGVVVTWWENERGQLGRGTIDLVNLGREPEPLPGIEQAVAAAGGPGFSLVLLADGTVLSWGENDEGQLGLGAPGIFPRAGTAMPPVPTPTRIPTLAGVRQLATGERFALALLADGTVMAWGDGQLGALGDGKGTGSGSHYAVPFARPVEGLGKVKAIAAGSQFGLALLADGTVKGWGANEYGQMGDDAVDFKPMPVTIQGLSGIQAIAAGGGGSRTAFAVLGDGTVVAWGRNDVNLFGPGATNLEKSSRPVPVTGLRNVVGLEASHGHVVALLSDGTVRTWGYDGFGELGGQVGADGLVMPALAGVVGVAAGGYRTYFLLEDGRLMVAGFRMADKIWRTPAFVTSLAAGGDPPCTSPLAGAHRGKWELEAGGVDRALATSIPKEQLEGMKATTERFTELTAAVFPRAVSVEAEGRPFARQDPDRAGSPLVFGYEAQYLGTVCEESSGRLRTVGGSYTGSEVVANSVDRLLEEFGELEIDGSMIMAYRLAPQIGEVAGLPIFEPWGSNARAVLVTRDRRLPFKMVSRGQYLEALKRHWQTGADEAQVAMDEAEIGIAREIERVKQELSGEMRDQVVAEMERALAELRAGKVSRDQKLATGVGEELAYINEYLSKHDATDLAKPGVLVGFGFRGEFHDGQPDAKTVVLVDESYWRRDLPRTAVQQILVYWEWMPGYPVQERWRAEFERAFDFSQLPVLLDQ